MKQIESYLSQIDPINVINKVSAFRKLNIKYLTQEELFQSIQEVLLYNGHFMYITNNGAYKEGTPFYRIRKLSSSVISDMEIRTEGDLWEPPVECCKLGRLNKNGESVLYTCPGNPEVAIKETHLKGKRLIIPRIY